MKFSGIYTAFILISILFIQIISCTSITKNEEYFYLNHNDTVDYVGINACKNCHFDKFETYIKTGMGQSFHYATSQKSAANFSKNHVVYDSIKNLYYSPFFKKEQMFILEYRLDGSDTIYKRIEKINFIIGSGQHTNSHLMLRNGYIYQAPLTWYTQAVKWDFPPGFENGKNSRFERIINDECISCHNSMPETDKSSEFKFLKIGTGIDCERCHGPGELHVNIHKQGKSIKSKSGIDRTIVNPAKLSWERQLDVCQRCHLQGNTVLKKDKNFLGFKPGMKLSDFYEVYMPDFENKESEFIMASHAQRLQKSRCFIISNQNNTKQKLTCITCHNPHITVKETKAEQFNNNCKNCHTKGKNCSQNKDFIKKENSNCIKCHMPGSGTNDIPHVQIHDHFIRKKPEPNAKHKTSKVLGLYCVNNPKPDDESLIKAYLSYYEKFDSKEIYLQKARKILDNNFNTMLEIHYLYLKAEYKKITNLADKVNEADKWTYYRIAQSHIHLKKWADAEKYMEKAVNLNENDFEFLYKLSFIKQKLNKTTAYELLLKKIIKLKPNHTAALNDLGFYYYKGGNYSLAMSYYNRSYQINPDYLPVLKNLFDYYLSANNLLLATKTAKQILLIEPQNAFLRNFIKENM